MGFLVNRAAVEGIRRSPKIRDKLLTSRESRLEAEQQKLFEPGCVGGLIIGGAKTYLEYAHWKLLIPSPWGIGDVIVLTEAALGADLPTFRKLDRRDRIVSAGLALAPLVPSVAFRGVWRSHRRFMEEQAFKIQAEIDDQPLPPHG
jgi:hypothetical protein